MRARNVLLIPHSPVFTFVRRFFFLWIFLLPYGPPWNLPSNLTSGHFSSCYSALQSYRHSFLQGDNDTVLIIMKQWPRLSSPQAMRTT